MQRFAARGAKKWIGPRKVALLKERKAGDKSEGKKPLSSAVLRNVQSAANGKPSRGRATRRSPHRRSS